MIAIFANVVEEISIVVGVNVVGVNVVGVDVVSVDVGEAGVVDVVADVVIVDEIVVPAVFDVGLMGGAVDDATGPGVVNDSLSVVVVESNSVVLMVVERKARQERKIFLSTLSQNVI